MQIDELGIEHGYDVDRMLWLGRKMEKTIGRRLRSEAVINGRTEKAGKMKFARPGLKKLIEKVGEKPGQRVPAEARRGEAGRHVGPHRLHRGSKRSTTRWQGSFSSPCR